MSGTKSKDMLIFAVLMAVMLVAPFAVYPVFLMKVLCFALFALAFNLLIGYAGLLSFGHAMFFGFAAYISGHTVKVMGFTPELGILAGVACAAVMGLVTGFIAIRRQGIYFAMVTLALSQMVFFFCVQAKFTGGEDGIQAIPRRALFACAFNLLIGYGGLLSFGHAMFLGTAGYITAHAAKVWGFPPEFAVLLGTGSAFLLGVITGLLAIRRQGIYFAMITLALAQMIYFFYLQAPFTHGEDGIQSVPRGKLFGFIDLANIWVMYFTVLVIFTAGFLLIYRVIHSPFGQVLKAIRENEARAISLGYDTTHYKFMAFVLSATLAGLAGATKALVFQLASLTDVHWTMSGEVVLMTLLGGLGTIFGPVVGALIIITMENYLAQLGAWVTIVQGAIFVVCVLTFRRGVIGEIAHFLKKPL